MLWKWELLGSLKIQMKDCVLRKGKNKMKYVSYIRVSTNKQKESGLGLEFQQTKIREFLKEEDELIEEFVEVSSGMKNNRKVLNECMKLCKRNNYTLLIYRLDRFSRRVSFISRIMEENIKFIVTQYPNSTPFQLHLFSVISEEERRRISENTKNSLKMCKLRGVELGKNGKYVLSKKNKEESIKFSNKYKEMFEKLIDEGNSYSSISRYMNSKGYLSYRGNKYFPQTIQNMIGYMGLKLRRV